MRLQPMTFALLMSLSATAMAETSLHFVGTAGLSAGGDTLATVTYTNGESEELKAGSLFYIGVGPSVEFKDSPWSVQALVGHHLDSVTATNGSMRFTRNTVDGQVFYRIGNHRLGAGLVTHLSPKYKISIDNVGSETGKFDTAQGASVEYNWLPVGNQFGVSVRFVKIDYELTSIDNIPVSASPVSGNHVAVGLYAYL